MAKINPITGRPYANKVVIPQSYDAPIVEAKPEAAVAVALEEKEPEPVIVQSETKQAQDLKEVVDKVVNDISRTVDEDKWHNIQVDSTVLSLFMACPQKYKYVIVDKLKSVDGLSKSIIRGSVCHVALLEYWKIRIISDDYEEAKRKAIRTAKLELDREDKFSHEEKLDTLQNLLEFCNFIQPMSWIPLEAEKYFKVKVFEDEGLKLRIFLTGRIDLIIKTPQISILPIDVKTESERWFYTQMSNQFKMYAIACGTNMLGVQRVGFQSSIEAKDKFKLEILPFDQDILDEFKLISIPYWVKQMIVAHEDNFYPMNSTNCVHGPFKCTFSDAYNGGICNVSRNVREQKLARYFVIGKAWDPSDI